jgi:hypothetical protein
MILIEKVEEYGTKLLNDISVIKKFLIVCDDSQLAKEVKDYTDSDNIILVGFIPSHETIGTNVDNVQDVDVMLWLVLEKNDSKGGHQATIESFKRTQLAVKAIKTQMLNDKPNFSCSNTMKELEVASFAIDPVWGLAGCDGYEINYKLKTPSY